MKTPVLETLIKSAYCEIFESTYFEKHLLLLKIFMTLIKVKNC